MTSNRSFFNVGLLRQTLRRNLWATVLSFVGFFFCLPLPMAIIVQNMSRDENSKAWEAILEVPPVKQLESCWVPTLWSRWACALWRCCVA